MTRFKKIKITSDDKLHIEYEKQNDLGTYDEYAMKSSEEALPSMYHAFDNLIPHVVEICELPDGDNLQHVYTIKGVSFSYGGDDEVMGATITATRALKNTNAPLVLNTPHKPQYAYADGADDSNCLTSECVEDLLLLCDEAQKFLDGKRAQTSLFDEQPEPEMALV